MFLRFLRRSPLPQRTFAAVKSSVLEVLLNSITLICKDKKISATSFLFLTQITILPEGSFNYAIKETQQNFTLLFAHKIWDARVLWIKTVINVEKEAAWLVVRGNGPIDAVSYSFLASRDRDVERRRAVGRGIRTLAHVCVLEDCRWHCQVWSDEGPQEKVNCNCKLEVEGWELRYRDWAVDNRQWRVERERVNEYCKEGEW